jgi:thiamine-monophosphate kinase
VSRAGANEGDVVVVTGNFGLTSVAFEILIGGKKATSELHQDALAAAYRPKIHSNFIASLAEASAVSASMDSSDGLGITLHTISKMSKCGITVDDLPVTPEVKAFCRANKLGTLRTVTQGGEEFLLVLTIPSDKYAVAQEIAEKQKVFLRKIGQVTTGDEVVWESEEGTLPIPFAGYDNFKEWE